MITLIYAAIAIAFLILVLGLFGKTRSHEPDECMPDNHSAPSTGNGRWLDLSERIFDPSDARWLAEELAFPKLAKALILGRKRLAIRWLEALQASFDEVVRTPELSPERGSRGKLCRQLADVVAHHPLQILSFLCLACGQVIWPLPSIDSILFMGSIFTGERAQFPASGFGQQPEFPLNPVRSLPTWKNGHSV